MSQRYLIEKQPIKLNSLTYTDAYQTATKILKTDEILTIKTFPHNSQFARLFIHTSRICIGQCCRLSLRDKLVLVFLNLPEKQNQREESEKGNDKDNDSNFQENGPWEEYLIGVASYKIAGYEDFEIKEKDDDDRRKMPKHAPKIHQPIFEEFYRKKETNNHDRSVVFFNFY